MPRLVKCTTWDGKSPWKYAQLKRDGLWLTITKDGTGSMRASSRTPRDVTDKVVWHPTLDGMLLHAPRVTTIWCEAYVSGGDREAVKAAMRDQRPELKIEAFAVHMYDGDFLPAYDTLEYVESLCECMSVPFVPYIRTSHDAGLDWSLEPVQSLPPAPDDCEGWVLKDGNLLNWRKVKPVETWDLVVIGYTEANPGKFEGLIGAVRLADATGREVCQVSGMSDDWRKWLTANQAYCMGRVVEVKAQGLGRAGGLMHPQWVSLRDDKTAAEADTVEIREARNG